MSKFYFALFYFIFVFMVIKEYLLNTDEVSLKYIAKEMWPNNKSANTYLTTKLKGKNPKRQWTQSDENLAREVLHNLGIKLQNL